MVARPRVVITSTLVPTFAYSVDTMASAMLCLRRGEQSAKLTLPIPKSSACDQICNTMRANRVGNRHELIIVLLLVCLLTCCGISLYARPVGVGGPRKGMPVRSNPEDNALYRPSGPIKENSRDQTHRCQT